MEAASAEGRLLGRCLVIGIVNVTPDSFSDGGRWMQTDAAIRHGLSLLANGADLIDVGGESTRPGAERVSPQEEMRRILPVIEGLVRLGARISVDTMRAETARAAISAGASMINDVSGGLSDSRMHSVVADAGVRYVVTHWRADSKVMHQSAVYQDVVTDVTCELSERVTEALRSGIARDRIVVDPGLGFSKESHHNWELLANLKTIIALGFPVMVGASRKGFLRFLDPDRPADPPIHRDDATCAISAYAAWQGAWAVRVHEPIASAQAVRAIERIRAVTIPCYSHAQSGGQVL